MSSAVHHLLLYLRLAAVSSARNQRLGQDRLLILAGRAACRAGLLDVAARCRDIILADNPRHALGRYETFPQALRDAEFAPLLKHLEQLCPPEQAEFLWQQQVEKQEAATAEIEKAIAEAEEGPSDSLASVTETAHRLLNRMTASSANGPTSTGQNRISETGD